jgi:hypothetical protein
MTVTNLKKAIHKAYTYLVENPVSIYPLVTFRIAFGILMLISTLRFWYNGWIEQLYLEPAFHFKYFGFYWIPSPSPLVIYSVFILLIVTCICISLGLFYRASIIAFFFLFSYTELIDATTYLNHYYFITIVSFVLIFLPANRQFAIDANSPAHKSNLVPAWTINVLKFQLAVVYFYAGLAKLNYTWLFEALPLKIWLPSNVHLPLIGELLSYNTTAYLFSWAGALFDLSIILLLIYKRTRFMAYLALIIFHLMTWYLFPIGMFPFVMIASTLIFFSEKSHEKFYSLFKPAVPQLQLEQSNKPSKIVLTALSVFISFQLLFPFRYLLYPGDLFWTEQGYRFSWRVMLMEKAGYATFTVEDGNGRKEIVDNTLYLSPFQEKMMSTQADFILQYANFLKDEYQQQGFTKPKVYADVFVTLNGLGSKRFINPAIDLAVLKDNFAPKKFILPYQ